MARYRRRYARSSRSRGQEIALQHIEDARRLTQELGGTDADVKEYFFSLPRAEFTKVLDLYEVGHGQQARSYAEATIGRWRSGQVHMSGMVASRLFSLLPPIMPLEKKYQLIANLWEHVGPRSYKVLRVGLDAEIEHVARLVREHVNEVVVRYQIPDSLERRFNWLSAGDSKVKQELLNHLRESEKTLLEQATRTQLPVMLEHLRGQTGAQTHRLAQILKIGNHEVEVVLDKQFAGAALTDKAVPRVTVSGSDWTWVWWLLGFLALLFVFAR